MSRSHCLFLRILIDFLSKAKKENKSVYGLGASTKGNVLLQYCGITEKLLTAIGEVNEDKFGSYTPGTKIPLISESDILKNNPDYLLVLPWHYKEFFLSTLNNSFNLSISTYLFDFG